MRDAINGVFWCQWAYWSSLGLAFVGYRYYPAGSVRTVVMLTPILPAVLIAVVSYWIYQDCDEYIRSRISRSVVVTAFVVAFVTLATFILEMFGYPRISALWLNLFGWSVFNVQLLYVLYRAR